MSGTTDKLPPSRGGRKATPALMSQIRELFIAQEPPPLDFRRQPTRNSATEENRLAILELQDHIHQLRREIRRPMWAATAVVLLILADKLGVVL